MAMTVDQQRRALVAALASGQMRRVPEEERYANHDSFGSVPDGLLTAAERSAYELRALAGCDVYAYRSATGTWNVWDGDDAGGRGARRELGRDPRELVH